ncbi:MAG: SGNH/GDSL hydrolase family protein [Anaerolineae bacterium]|nr:SGNH/GDSL hydrolase family protein [Anaerolineae bacterium]
MAGAEKASPSPTSSSLAAIGVKRRQITRGLLVSLITVLLMLSLGEFYFRYIHLQSDVFAFTLMHQRWRSVCWKPLNPVQYSDGVIEYRDRSWTEADVAGKIKVMVVGDSFAAGHGICNAQDRFGDVLQTMLGDQYVVFNVANGGWNTLEEWRHAVEYPFKPDIVILSYVINDIDVGIADVYGDLPVAIQRPQANWLIDNSYLFDYIYWQVLYRRLFQQNNTDILNYELNAYFDPKVWTAQEVQLKRFVDWSQEINAKLVIMAWPHLSLIPETEKQTRMVEDYFRDQGATVVSGVDLFHDDAPSTITVSSADAHPNEAAHHRAAVALYEALNK